MMHEDCLSVRYIIIKNISNQQSFIDQRTVLIGTVNPGEGLSANRG